MENNLITEEQLQALKAQYGKVYVIGFNHNEVTDSEFIMMSKSAPNPQYDPDYPSADFVFKQMDLDVFAASTSIAMEKPIQAIKMQMEATLVWGKKELLSDIVVFKTISTQFNQINEARHASLKKI